MNWMELFPWRRCVKVAGTIEWLVDYYHDGPPPIAIELLNGKRAFFEKLVKLLDIKKAKDARTIIFAKKSALDPKFVELSTSFGVYVVLDEEFLVKAINGEDVFEVNSAIIKSFKNREIFKSCRDDVLELLSNECLTLNEIMERLSFKYERVMIRNQVRRLLSSERILKLCRLSTGEVVYGLHGRIYRMRDDLSSESKKKYIRGLILDLVRSKPMNYSEIAEALGLSRGLVTSALRELKKKGLVKKQGDKWIPQTSGEG